MGIIVSSTVGGGSREIWGWIGSATSSSSPSPSPCAAEVDDMIMISSWESGISSPREREVLRGLSPWTGEAIHAACACLA